MRGTTVFIFLVLLIAGVAGVSASTYGLGTKYNDRSSSVYKVAEVGTIIGAIMTAVSLGALTYGAFRCRRQGGGLSRSGSYESLASGRSMGGF